MYYEILYTITLVIFALIIAWCFFKIRRLKDENTRLKIDLSCLSSDNEVLRFELQNIDLKI